MSVFGKTCVVKTSKRKLMGFFDQLDGLTLWVRQYWAGP